jgi:hypothetical protein
LLLNESQIFADFCGFWLCFSVEAVKLSMSKPFVFQDLRVFNLDEMLVCSCETFFLPLSLSVGTVADAGGRGGPVPVWHTYFENGILRCLSKMNRFQEHGLHDIM